MPWGRLDDKGNSDAKLLALSDAAWRMWGCGLIYCQNALTDGFIPDHVIHTFGVRAANKLKVAEELCSRLVPGKGPLWHKVEGGYIVHDYLDHNDSRDEVLKERERSRVRQENFRKRRRGNGDGHLLDNADGHGERHALHNAGETVDPQPLPQSTAEERSAASAEADNRKPHPIRDLLGYFQEKYLEAVGVKPHIAGGRDSKAISELLKQHDEETVRRSFDAYFSDGDDYVRKAGFTLSLFISQFNRWLAKAQAQKALTPRRGTNTAKQRYADAPQEARR